MYPYDVLLKYYWSEPREVFNKLRIYYVSRPEGESYFYGSEVESITKIGVELYSGSVIPYHRIFRIMIDSRIIYDRTEERKKAARRVHG